MRLILILTLISTTAACSWFTEYVQVPVYHRVTCPDVSPPVPIRPRPVEPSVITGEGNQTWVAITPEHYENLAINTRESIRYIRDQQGVIRYYRGCVVDYNRKVDELDRS